jgi:hypothetical protein
MTDTENPHAGQGSVLLDIGGDIGALVVTMPEDMVGSEVEIRPVEGHHTHAGHTHVHVHRHDHAHHGAGEGDHGHGSLVHVAVVARPAAGATVPSLVFPELAAGAYDLFVKGQPEAVVLTAAVEGGRVTSAEWTGAPTREEHGVGSRPRVATR